MPLIPDPKQPASSKLPPHASRAVSPQPRVTTSKPHSTTSMKSKVPATKPHKRTKRSSSAKKSADIQTRRKKILAIVAVLLVITIVLGWVGYTNASTMYSEAMAAKEDLDSAQLALTEQRFTDANDDFENVITHLEATQEASGNLFWIKWLPLVSTQFKAVDHIVAGGIHASKGAQYVSVVGDSIFNSIEGDNTSLNEIGGKERKAILKSLSETPDTFKEAQVELGYAIDEFEEIPTKGLVAPLALVVNPLTEQLPLIDQLVNKALPFLEVAPMILGYPEDQTYLFLLQNNTELRATGGFIGSYGILNLENGDIKDFYTDNIYNLDYPYRDDDSAPKVAPPEPISKYLGIYEWYMRDSNWNPHFPATAEKAIEFYYREGGKVDNIDGVIAVDQTFIKSLLDITGPITVEGDEYTPENLDDVLHEKVELSFEAEGRTQSSRKEIIGNLAAALMDRLQSLPKSQWGVAFEVLINDLEHKSLLLYFEDDASQKLVEELGWAGAIQRGYEDDYLLVVDSNLAAKKTDEVMVRNFNYGVTKEGDDYIANLELYYQNDGFFDYFTTRYNSYTRVYVPAGSEIIESDGFRTHDRNVGGEPTQVIATFDEDLNRTVFEGFISIEPQTNETIRLKYKLPQSIADGIESGEYRLYWQKQPGVEDISAQATLEFDSSIESFTGVDGWEQNGNNTLRLNRAFETDNDLTVQFK